MLYSMVWVFKSLFGDLGFCTMVILRWVRWFIYGIIMVFFLHVDVHACLAFMWMIVVCSM
jgi:hypothetical protein